MYTKLTVIIGDPAPLAAMEEPVSHRRVTVNLTQEQIEKLEFKRTGFASGKPIHERVTLCFLE